MGVSEKYELSQMSLQVLDFLFFFVKRFFDVVIKVNYRYTLLQGALSCEENQKVCISGLCVNHFCPEEFCEDAEG